MHAFLFYTSLYERIAVNTQIIFIDSLHTTQLSSTIPRCQISPENLNKRPLAAVEYCPRITSGVDANAVETVLQGYIRT